MNITVIGGAGYVGFTTAACLAFKGHKVYCVDQDLQKVERMLNWQPCVALEDGVSRTISWFKENSLN